jgi:hypothetical protein
MTVSNATFLPNSSDTMIGSATFTWIEDGAFLALYQGTGPSGTPDARWIVGRDESERDYTVLYVDGRGVSRVYGMRFMERTCMLWRESSDFSQRFTATLSDDQNTISGHWEKRLGTGSWEHDFDVSYQQTA